MLPLPAALVALALPLAQSASPEDIAFDSQQLSAEFFAEGGTFGDFDHDGVGDVVVGPYWYAGPEFKERRRFYEGEAFDPGGYSQNFFNWARDFDDDGWDDLFVITFPGQEAHWLRNPRYGKGPWARHTVYANVDNESPHFTDVNGDGLEDLVCHSDGILCWLERDPSDPTAPWIKHELSERLGLGRFTHGMGVGDVSGDGRVDVLLNTGWWEQPESLEGDPTWIRHPFLFSRGQGGAQMLVTDVDGDGDNDVVTSLNAHKYGLSWFENHDIEGRVDFREHPIMGETAGEFDCPLAVSELHALALADVDGDGLDDVITGKRYMSHGFNEGGARDPAYLLWFRLERSAAGAARYVPHVIHDNSGVGTQVVAGDVNADGLVDVVVGNKMGAFVHLQRSAGAPPVVVAATEDDRFPPGAVLALGLDGEPLNLDFETGTLEDWSAEGAAFEGQPVEGDTVVERRGDMKSDHAGAFWLGGYERSLDEPVGTLTSDPFIVTHPWAAFLIAGGRSESVRVEIVLAENDQRVGVYSGRNHESLRPTVADLSEQLDKPVYLRIVDDASGGWGHINFDHFRLYPARPEFTPGLEVESTIDFVANEGLEPAAAAAAMTVPDGFHVDLVAGEPDLHQPIALTIDERGRLWVAEAYAYPVKRDSADAQDKILIFEDTDGDGSYETRKVFADGLNLVSGLEVGYGGVFVGAAPELLFLADANGDDVADGPGEVLLDGFGYQDTHETLNAFLWGPDGWLYGCHGVFTHSKVGAPGTPDEERVGLNAGVWRYHPKERDFEVFAWGSSNPWGLDFDDRGQAVITACVIPHLFHMIQGGRYHRQGGSHFNPHVYADIPTFADHRHWIGDTPHSGNGVSNDAGGGHAHCGAMIYLGDSWPARYRNTLFMNNVHGNRMNNDLLVAHRSGYIGLHADDFLIANDRWFRGINMRYGPDGSVFLIDWYDKQACHYVSEDIWNRTNGRLYRVSYGDAGPPKPVDLGALAEDELVELQLHPNDWYVRTARRLLAERGLSDAGARRLEGIVREHPALDRRLRGLWALRCGDALTSDFLLEQLRSDEPDLRAWAIQLACESGAPTRSFLAEMERLAPSDPSAVVRLYLASALQRLPLRYRWRIAEGLASHAEDADDPNIPYLLWYGVEPLVSERPEAAIALARTSRVPHVTEWIFRRAASDAGSHEALVNALGRARDASEQLTILDQTLVALERKRGLEAPATWTGVYPRLAQSPEPDVRNRALVLAALFGDARAFPELRELVANSDAQEHRRELAIEALVRGKDPAAVPILCALLEEDAMRGRALRALASFEQPEVPHSILATYASFDEAQRRDAVSTLTSRAPSAIALLDAIEEGGVDRTQLTAFELRKLRALGDESVDSRITEVWGVYREVGEDKQPQMERWRALLSADAIAAADRSWGRDVFARTCMRCHTLYDVGQAIGPDITGSNRSDLEYLLQNMVDPNAVIPKEYQMTVVLTDDGLLQTGILVEESDDAVTLQTENDLVTIARDEIDVLKADSNSMMPVGQLETLTEEEIVALVAYLQHDRQVPQRLRVEDTSSFFDGETLAGWSGNADLWRVDDGEIIGDSPGIDRNEFLVSDYQLGDFRLVLEVRLTPNEENSGIQFRSRSLDEGGVAGYQADVGLGWWGDLYDEHGRGSLVSNEDVARPGQWNTYEILAVGDHIRTAINGQVCVDFVDPEPVLRGVVALQIHSGGALEVRFKNLQLELDPEPVLETVAGSER